jgi:YVTN family beta-propeller protein
MANAFTTNIAAMSVSAIDVATRKVRATFPVGARIEGLAVSPNGREVWVGGNESHQVYVLNAETGAVLHTIPGFGMPYRIGITPDGKTAVVSDPGAEKIHLVDVASHTVRSVIAVEAMAGVAASPQGVTVSRDGTTAFVTLKAVGRSGCGYCFGEDLGDADGGGGVRWGRVHFAGADEIAATDDCD